MKNCPTDVIVDALLLPDLLVNAPSPASLQLLLFIHLTPERVCRPCVVAALRRLDHRCRRRRCRRRRRRTGAVAVSGKLFLFFIGAKVLRNCPSLDQLLVGPDVKNFLLNHKSYILKLIEEKSLLCSFEIYVFFDIFQN